MSTQEENAPKNLVSTEFGIVFGSVVGFLATIGVARRLGKAAARKITAYTKTGKLLTLAKG